MAKWDGCKEEKCKLWDDGFCMLSDGNYEYCKRNGENYHPKTSNRISEDIIKILEGKSAIEWNEGYHACVEDLKDLLDKEEEAVKADLRFIPVPAHGFDDAIENIFNDTLNDVIDRLDNKPKGAAPMTEQPNNEKCRFCESTETHRDFWLRDVDSSEPGVHIICEPICFDCIKEKALKGELI